jgi:hypothetical protein
MSSEQRVFEPRRDGGGDLDERVRPAKRSRHKRKRFGLRITTYSRWFGKDCHNYQWYLCDKHRADAMATLAKNAGPHDPPRTIEKVER